MAISLGSGTQKRGGVDLLDFLVIYIYNFVKINIRVSGVLKFAEAPVN